MTLPIRAFGRTDLRPTALGFGAMELKRLSDGESELLLNRALDEDINYIDTSPDYPTSEERIGRFLAGRRDEFILATKCGCNPHLDEPGSGHKHTFDAATLERNIEESLRLLRTDHIDVWQLHGATPDKLIGGPAGEVVQTMQRLKRQGKVRYIGVSLRHGPKTESGYPTAYGYHGIQQYITWSVFDMIQIVYGGMVRASEEAIRRGAEHGLGIVVRGVVRNYRDSFPQLFRDAGLEDLLEEGEDRHSFLTRFALSHPSISTMIIGTRDQEHLAANVRTVLKGPLSPKVYAEAKRRLASIGSEPGAIPTF
ncbi:MAG: hypothetical protein AUK03_16530 [Anaerolineae bacterium CG2_30_64_16]|nr:MAG: hypothetical protein AUK03_16530 [Anaerolineae bacterium CG2_30_64_16]